MEFDPYSSESSDFYEEDEHGEILEDDDEDANAEVKFLTLTDVCQLMRDEIREVMDVIGLPENDTKQLLNWIKWDKITLLERFYDDGKEKLFAMARITQVKEFPLNEPRLVSRICEICFEGVECVALACGHDFFCEDCIEHYVTTRILNGTGERLTCPGHNCDFVLGDATVLSFLRTSEIRKKFQYLITSDFVANNRFLRYCPQPRCTSVIKSELLTTTVDCECGHSFCFKCGDATHEPVKCEVVRCWEELVKSDGGSKQWIHEFTRPCPRCSTPINKDGGCNVMSCCRCSFEFCWVCGKKSVNHVACDDSKKPPPPPPSEHFDLKTYSNLFLNMDKALRLEQKFLYHEYADDWFMREFIRNAARVLFKNRRVLMYSYVFAFYIDANHHKTLFEENLAMLREATEELYAMLERDVKTLTANAIEDAVRDKTRFCEMRRRIMVDFVRDGYDHNYWRERSKSDLSKGN